MACRSIVYIDGFNLYYGALRHTVDKWLDLERYFSLLRRDDDLRQIYYFTAMIRGPRLGNQQTYLRALDLSPVVQIVLGKYKLKPVKCGVKQCKYKGDRSFQMPEEKRTDVSIATQLLDDAYQDKCDIAVIVSGDSDLVPVITRLKRRFPAKQVVVYVPARDPKRGAAVELRSAADKDRTLPVNLFRKTQFPAIIPDGSGGFIEKPEDW